MVVKTVNTIYCDVCSCEITNKGDEPTISIRASSMFGQKGARTLNGDYCSKACFLKELEESGAF